MLKTGRHIYRVFRRTKQVALIGLPLICGACSNTPVPFEFSFDGESSGSGYLRADRLTSDRMRGIVMIIDLVPERDKRHDITFMRALASNGVLEVSLNNALSGPPTRIEVYEFSEPVPGFYWYHLNYQDFVGKRWNAIEGDVSVEFHRDPDTGRGRFCTVRLSNLVFQSSESTEKRTIDNLIIDNVHLGGIRE